MTEWIARGGPVERGEPPSDAAAAAAPPAAPRRSLSDSARSWSTMLVDAIEGWSTTRLFTLWLAMIVACGIVYWVAPLVPGNGLSSGGEPIGLTWTGLGTAVYFSFVTAATVGYGDVVPMGALRVLAVAEAVAGLLAFGAVVSKFVSRRSDQVVREIHRVTFEDRLDRVQTNLHLVLSELQAVASACDEGPSTRLDRAATRLESTALVFAGELRAIHDLLYRPQQMPDEPVLEAILASLAAVLRELAELLACLPSQVPRSATLAAACRTIAALADEVCGECVPHAYAPALTAWMDQVQETARRIRGAA